MTDDEIVLDWLDNPENANKLIINECDEMFYDFILRNAYVISNRNGTFYRIGTDWLRLIKNNQLKNKII